VFVKQFLGFFQADAFADRHQIFTGHDVADLFGHVGFETQIPVGDDAHQLIAPGHRHPEMR
jgi:hypothetical protein